MNYELLKKKMDKFFEETSSEYLINKFERMGYSFLDIEYGANEINISPNINIVEPKGNTWLSNLFRGNKKTTRDLDKFEVFFCKLAIW